MAAWYDSAVFYHMYPLGMVGAEKQNPYKADMDAAQRFGAFQAYLPYLSLLGCDAIYIGPLFSSDSHGYDTRDYRKIDERLGTNADFQEFVRAAHARGIRVVVDGVFNHTGRNFFAFQDLREKGAASPYAGWYRDVNFYGQSPFGDGFSYRAWQGHFELPELNHQNPEVRRYLLETVRYWVETFDIDGIRLDCANVLDLDFQKALRHFTEGLKPEFWLMGEVIHGQYERWVNAETLHSVTNYELHKSMYSGFNSHNFFEIAHNVRRLEAIGRELYTFLENHDEDRIASKLENKANLAPIYMALFTLPGKPSIYYGGEFGMEGQRTRVSDVDLRPPVTAEGMKPNALTELIAKLAQIHQNCEELHMGVYKELYLQCKQYAYARLGAHSAVICALNNDEHAAELEVHLPMQAEKAVDLLSGKTLALNGDTLRLALEANAGRIIRIQ